MEEALVIGHVNILKGVEGVRSDFRNTGRRMLNDREADPSTGLPSILLKLFTRKYSYVVLPALNWPWLLFLSKKSFKSWLCLGMISQRGTVLEKLIRSCVGLVLGKKVVFGFIDRLYMPAILEPGGPLSGQNAVYFKSHLTEGFVEGSANPAVRYLPMWIDNEFFDLEPPKERAIDVFFAGSLANQERRSAVEAVEVLREEGYNIEVIEGRISFSEYVERLRCSKIVLSPPGANWHCFRHYEVIAAGAEVMLKDPGKTSTDIVADEHGHFYQKEEDLTHICREILEGKRKLKYSSSERMKFALDFHSRLGVGEYVYRELKSARTDGKKDTAEPNKR